jgi:hypothetical protein
VSEDVRPPRVGGEEAGDRGERCPQPGPQTGRPRRVIPGATRLCERLGQRQRSTLISRLVAEQRGDRGGRRHDTLARQPSTPRQQRLSR